MKLLRLKLLSPFRGLPKDFEIKFHETGYNHSEIEPLCFVGLNGSGKSNTLEVIAEIFFRLELYALSNTEKEIKQLEKNELNLIMSIPESNGLGFELEYELDQKRWEEYIITTADADKLFSPQTPGIIKCIKEKGKRPQILVGNKNDSNEEFIPFANSNWNKFLPHRIVGYSSGQNELISNPFIKMDYHYFNEFEVQVKADTFEKIEMNRLFFMDYDSNKMVLLANYLIAQDSENRIQKLNKELGIEDLKSFRIDIRLRNFKNQEVVLPLELKDVVANLKECATSYEEIEHPIQKGSVKIKILRLDYFVDEAIRQAFKFHFKTPFYLYRCLYLLRLLNIHMQPPALRAKIRSAEAGTNITGLIPKHEEQMLVFNISDIAFRKHGVNKPVYYKQLSDGEHQLLHVFGTILLMSASGNIFILDEPETHFNPDWRSKFVRLLNDCTFRKDENKSPFNEGTDQEFLITSHSPFIISDCRRENVFIFERDTHTNQVYYRQLEEGAETFGASVNYLTMKVFGKSGTISELGVKKIESIRTALREKSISKAEAIEEAFSIGESVERMLLIEEIDKVK